LRSGSTSQYRVGIGVPSSSNGWLRITTGVPSGWRTTTVKRPRGTRPNSSPTIRTSSVSGPASTSPGSAGGGRAALERPAQPVERPRPRQDQPRGGRRQDRVRLLTDLDQSELASGDALDLLGAIQPLAPLREPVV